jgi:hypothetical protein
LRFVTISYQKQRIQRIHAKVGKLFVAKAKKLSVAEAGKLFVAKARKLSVAKAEKSNIEYIFILFIFLCFCVLFFSVCFSVPCKSFVVMLLEEMDEQHRGHPCALNLHMEDAPAYCYLQHHINSCVSIVLNFGATQLGI